MGGLTEASRCEGRLAILARGGLRNAEPLLSAESECELEDSLGSPSVESICGAEGVEGCVGSELRSEDHDG
ncbi:hypothetical protein H920_05432 [Fukomys damarensis]|uniref:Uncharacterized protein n=1 Tax=Fukomys damarensis TaxID=885580 RepID=A0A091DMA5_FUKDA|nr:hypothetical protein H920_05432 [Fukomys damarensis]